MVEVTFEVGDGGAVDAGELLELDRGAGGQGTPVDVDAFGFPDGAGCVQGAALAGPGRGPDDLDAVPGAGHITDEGELLLGEARLRPQLGEHLLGAEGDAGALAVIALAQELSFGGEHVRGGEAGAAEVLAPCAGFEPDGVG